MNKLPLLLLAATIPGCYPDQSSAATLRAPVEYKTINDIPTSSGYTRIKLPTGSFGNWLRHLSFKKDDKVYLYNGELKENQSAQFAVIDISVGNKDLQQCADAIMRLRAEYLLASSQTNVISFRSSSGQDLRFSEWREGVRYKLSGQKLVRYKLENHQASLQQDFTSYLNLVFNYCGTYSLQQQLRQKKTNTTILPGDVFIKGGFPGHAMLVVDVAENKEGKKIFMLAQSYMPAQDIHVVRNPLRDKSDPWYEEADMKELETPEWTFYAGQLYEW